MTQWTDITDQVLEPGRPVRSVDGLALRDNPVAIAEGAPGAPRIDGEQGPAVDTGGLFDDAVTNPKVADGTLSANKFRTTNTERNWVLGRTSAASVGAVGTYAFLAATGGSAQSSGATFSGSSLRYGNAAGTTGTQSPSGTWRLMGALASGTDYEAGRTSQWLRIS